MNLDQYIQVGKLYKPHGLKGELNIGFDFPFFMPEREEEALKVLFVGKKQSPLPYFIEYIKETGKGLLVKFEDVNDRNAAVLLSNKMVFLPEDQLAEHFDLDDDEGAYGFLTGFQLYNQEEQLIATIEDVLLFPQQELAQISYEGREVLIPLADELIIEINEAKQKLVIQLQEGLLDL